MCFKNWIFFKNRIKIRQARLDDIPEILFVEKETWGKDKAATQEMFESRIKTFPEGVLVAEFNKKIVGVVVTERVNYDIKKDAFTWYEITDNGYIKNSHRSDGDSIYGVDLSILPAFQNKKVGSKLLEAIGKLAIKYNIKKGLLGGRIPCYHKYATEMSPEEYITKKVKIKNKEEALDPEVRFYQRAGLKIIKIIPNYFEDPESLNYGILLLWENPFYNKWYRWIAAKFFRI